MSYELKLKYPDELPEKFKDEFMYVGSCSSLLCVEEDGEIVRVYSDNYEPEDTMFSRDLGELMSEMKKAYQKGLKDAGET